MTSPPEQTLSAENPRATVIRVLQERISQGEWSDGRPLPSSSVLAQEIGVNRKTVQRAIRMLREDRILEMAGPRTCIVGPDARVPGVLTNTLCLIASELLGGDQSREPGWSDWVLRGMVDAADKAGTNSLIINPERQEATIRQLRTDRPMGIVCSDVTISPDEKRALLARLGDLHVPVTVFDGDPAFDSFDRVMSDHEQGAYDLTQWLLKSGSRKILLVWQGAPDAHWWMRARWAGHERAMRDVGMDIFPPVQIPKVPHCAGNPSLFHNTARSIADCLAGTPHSLSDVDAIMADSDRTVYSLAAACRLLGREPRNDIRIVGYDNYWRDCAETEFESCGPEATVDKFNYEIGRELIGLLLDRIKGTLPKTAQTRSISPTVIDCRTEAALPG